MAARSRPGDIGIDAVHQIALVEDRWAEDMLRQFQHYGVLQNPTEDLVAIG